jgi:hypothetical protein
VSGEIAAEQERAGRPPDQAVRSLHRESGTGRISTSGE